MRRLGQPTSWMPDTPPKLINKKAGEKSLAPVRDRGLTVGEQRRLREQGRPDLARAEYDSQGRNWLLDGGRPVDPNSVSADRRLNADRNVGWSEGVLPSDPDKLLLRGAMSPETQQMAPVGSTGAEFRQRIDEMMGPEVSQDFWRRQGESIDRKRAKDGQPPLEREVAPPPRPPDGSIAPPDTSNLMSTIGLRGGGTASAAPPRTPEPGIIASPDTSGIMNTIGLRGGGTASATPGFFSAGGMGAGALAGASGALSGIMADADDMPMGDGGGGFEPRNPIRDAALVKARMFARGGRLTEEELDEGVVGVVGEEGPEIVERKPDGDVVVTPMRDRNLLWDKSMEGQVARPGRPSPYTAQERGVINAEPFGLAQTAVGDGVARPTYAGTDGLLSSGISPEAPMDEGGTLPPRQSPMDIRRIIARNNAGLSDEGVWQAREDVANEDAWQLMNTPVKKSPWKDFGMRLLTSLNNQVNDRKDPVRGWEEIKRDEKLGELAPRLEFYKKRKVEQQQREAFKVRQDDIKTDNENRRLAIDNAAKKAERQYDLQRATLDFRIEDRKEYYDLEEIKQAARERKDMQTYEIADRKQKELERNNRARIEAGDRKIESTEETADRRIQANPKSVKLPPRSTSTPKVIKNDPMGIFK